MKIENIACMFNIDQWSIPISDLKNTNIHSKWTVSILLDNGAHRTIPIYYEKQQFSLNGKLLKDDLPRYIILIDGKWRLLHTNLNEFIFISTNGFKSSWILWYGKSLYAHDVEQLQYLKNLDLILD